MSGNYTEVSSVNWFQRLGQSCMSVVIGVFLFFISFIILFWNEGRAVKTAKGLEEGAKNVVSLSAPKPEAKDDGKLVHTTGEATTADTLTDADFGVSVKALRLERIAQIYQYKEEAKSETKKKLGGGEETVTTYTYPMVWTDGAIDSSTFKDEKFRGKNFGSITYPNKTDDAKTVKLGDFILPSSLWGSMKSESLSPDAATLPSTMKDTVKVNGGYYYLGKDPTTPAIGDVRIEYKVIKPATVSVIAKEVKDTFEPYKTEQDTSISMLQMGTVSAGQMFQQAQDSNTTLTWILRLVGFVAMTIGITLFFRPLVVFADVIPIFGSLLQAGAVFFALLLAAPLSLITIALGWIVYRPLLGIALLAGAGIIIAGAIMLAMKLRRPKTKMA